MCLSLTQYLSVVDNARYAVLLHVSTSSERQERGNETGAMTKKTKQHMFKQSHSCDSNSYNFIQYSIWQCTLSNILRAKKLIV
jgi:hypothetical protein